MSLSWSVLVLALIGMDDQQPSQPKAPNPPITITVDFQSLEGEHVASCRKDAAAIVVEMQDCAEPKRPRKAGILAKMAGVCADQLAGYVFDEAKAAVIAKIAEATACDPDAAERSKDDDAEVAAAFAHCFCDDLPVPLPKVAKPRTVSDPEPKESWPLTLPDAIRIALDNSEVVRVISFGAQGIPVGGFEPTALKAGTPANDSQPNPKSSPILIARLNADASEWRFKAELMAELRSVEQQYWSLAQTHVQLWAADRAVGMAQEILNREQADLAVGRGTVADVAEAAQRLEQFNLDLVTRTSDVITTERQLRNLLGLPPCDNRKIIPVTPATDLRVEFDWDSCLHEMMDNQPDIAQQKLLVRVAELQLMVARHGLLPPLSLDALYQLYALGTQPDSPFATKTGYTLAALQDLATKTCKAASQGNIAAKDDDFVAWQSGYTFQTRLMMRGGPIPNTRQAQYILLRSRSYLDQVVRQTTHSLARFFLEIDANDKQYRTAVRLRNAAAQRLDAQRAYYEEGRITIDRFLDSVSQYATAVATEAQYKTTYNISLAALAEAKGTLLADRNIVISEGPRSRKAHVTATTVQVSVPAVPSKAAIPGLPVTSDSIQRPAIAPASRWKGIKDPMTVATGFTEPEPIPSVEVPRMMAFIAPPPLLGLAPSCCDSPSTTETARTAGTGAKQDPACVATKAETTSTAAQSDPSTKAKTWTFSISIGGANPLQIKGTIKSVEGDEPASSDDH